MKALLVLDMIQIYIYGEKPLVKTSTRKQLIANIKTATTWAHRQKIAVIYVNSAFLKQDPIMRIIGYRSQAMRGAAGTHVIAELAQSSDDCLLEKRGYDGFWKSGLEKLL
jgi:isochorismate hydrolase